ncbi:MAG: hypothetical protein Q7V53_02860 [Caldisericota bacterium]|nr:hypothetical protein [Caldisericota bacterium]
MIDQAFPKVEPKRISKALENAAHRRLIHSVGRGQYRAGPKPEPTSNMRNSWLSQAELDAMAQAILPTALSNRTPIETAWFGVARTGRASAMSA